MNMINARFFVLIAPAICIVATCLCGISDAQTVPPDGIFRDAIEKTSLRTVKIWGATIGLVDGYGTGLIVSDDGKILTADGVYLRGTNIRVTLNDGTQYNARMVRRDDNLQLALLEIDASTPDYFQLTDQPIGKKGDWVLGISNAFKVAERTEPLSVNLGLISLRTNITAKVTRREIAYNGPLILIDAITSNPGAGGGALVNASGELVGMIGKVIQSNDTNTRLNYAVPQESLLAFLEDRLVVETAGNPKSDKKADLGIRLFRLNGDKSAAYVDRVILGGAASKAGVRSDDLIISVDGDSIKNIADLNEVIDTLVPGEEIVIVVKRRSQLLQLKIVPDEKE